MAPRKYHVFVFFTLVGLRDTVLLAFRARSLGSPSFQWESEKLGHYMWGLNPLTLREKLGVGGSLPIAGNWDFGENVSRLSSLLRSQYFLIRHRGGVIRLFLDVTQTELRRV